MVELIEAKDQYLSAFEPYIEHTAGNEPTWMTELRKQAASYFRDIGFPHRKVEEWRFTNIRPILEQSFETAKEAPTGVTSDQIEEYSFSRHCHVLVFVNGHYSPQLSSVDSSLKEIKIDSLANALKNDPDALEPYYSRMGSYETNAFSALNTAFAQDGTFIYIPRDIEIEKPIHILFVTTSPNGRALSYPRNLIVTGSGSKASVVESYIGLGDDTYLTNALTEVVVGENADLEHCRIQRESLNSYHISSMQIYMEHASRFQTQSVMLGSAITRNEVISKLDAEDIMCTMNGLYMPKDNQHVENHTLIEHAKPNCNSWELYKGILDDQASGVFRGKIYVAQDAQKTDSKQSNNAMLLSDDAHINTMPQLEIYADDVKCTHGATTGRLDEDKLFYLRSRGIPLEEAKGLLIHAFASEIIQCVPLEAIQNELQKILFSQLPLRSFEKE